LELIIVHGSAIHSRYDSSGTKWNTNGPTVTKLLPSLKCWLKNSKWERQTEIS